MKKLLLPILLSFVTCVGMAQETEKITKDTSQIPILTLSETELETEDEIENISSLLSASNDVFGRAAAFNFGVARFKIRGYNNNATQIYVNGSSMNDLETGGTYWSLWGGLNDVFRNRSTTIGLNPAEFGFGGLNGATNIDIGAASQRKQIRLAHAYSNRSYNHRIMGVYSPTLKNDWHLTLSASKRFAREGYIAGTFYDAYSYFLGVEKKFGNQALAFNFLGAPNYRGKSAAVTLEMTELAGTNYYNPNWGYQNGIKRNARVANSHQPIAILQHKWNISDQSKLSTSVSYQFGRNGSTALEWNRARDPRPDYYRRLPSYVLDPVVQQQLKDKLLQNPELLQLDWDAMYAANINQEATAIENANGQTGNTIQGKRSRYIVEDRRYDRKKFDFNVNFNTALSDITTLTAGAYYRRQNTHNHKRVEDLLGGDFYYDIDRFAERDFQGDPDKIQNDLNNPNRVVKEGDIFGYSYDANISQVGGWAQAQFNLQQFDVFAAANVGAVSFWRTGNYKNGRFPDSSYGDSEKQNFLDLGAKLGVTYKLDGRNYFFVNGAYMQRPPNYRESYLSPRTRNTVVPGLTEEKIATVEGGYNLKSPYYKARISGFYTNFRDGVETMSFYNDFENDFGNLALSGINRQHFGVELALDVQIATGLSFVSAASIGQYTYTNRPSMTFTLDNTNTVITSDKVYQENFYVSRTPQRAYTAGFRYNSPKFWFLNVNFNYFDEMYLSFNPVRRTEEAVTGFDKESDVYKETIHQTELDNQYTLDLFGGKSWRLDRRHYIYLTVGVSNILNNKKFITGGYEQLRYDKGNVDRFPNRYYFAYGTNFFAQVAFRF